MEIRQPMNIAPNVSLRFLVAIANFQLVSISSTGFILVTVISGQREGVDEFEERELS